MKGYIQNKDIDSGKVVLQSLIPFSVLKDKALFTCKANAYNSKELDYHKLAEENQEYYQRRIDSKRITEIQQYITSSIIDEKNKVGIATLFPSSMIIAFDDADIALNEQEEIEYDIKSNCFIVDGQHRLMAMVTLYETLTNDKTVKTDDYKYIINYLENYKFNCTVLVNFDIWEQGQVFINVNFKQKPVNKSLYYEVFGSEYRESSPNDKRNKVYLAHCLVKDLNTCQKSPFYQKIKMLGTGNGYVSQAFFVEAILPLFSPNNIWPIDTSDTSSVNDDYKSYLAELLTFFTVIKETFSDYWPKDDDTKATLICKTTGIGALVRLMAFINSESEYDLFNTLRTTPVGEINNAYYKYIKRIIERLQPETDALFGAKSEFLAGSGKGMETKMFKRLRSILLKDKRTIVTDSSIHIYSQLTPHDKIEIEAHELVEQLLDYYWTHADSELDSLAHHYEYEDMDDFKIESCINVDGVYECKVSFDSNVTLYLDSEDEKGFSQTFPTEASFSIISSGDSFEIDEDSIKTKFDTSDY